MRRRALLRASGAGLGTIAASFPASAPAAATRGRTRVPRLQDAYEPLARLPIDNAAEAVVGDDGETAYVAATTGFVTVDVSDPAEPAVLAEERRLSFDEARANELLDIKVDGDRMVIAGPANPSADAFFHGFAVYDVSDPASPELLEAYETGEHIHNCYLEGDLCYVCGNGRDANPLVIYDVADGVEEVGRWSLLEREPGWEEVYWVARYLHDVYVQDGIAYLSHWDAGTYLIDVSDPAEPEYLSRVQQESLAEQRKREAESGSNGQVGLPGNDHYAAVDETGDLLAVGREAWATGSGDPDRPGGIDLYDVSDPAEPIHRASIEAPRAVNERYNGGLWTTAHNFELRNGRLYSAWYQGGVKIHDVSDPADPEELASWRDPAEAGFWTAQVIEPGETFVATSTPLIPNSPTTGALYTFPIEAGQQADPPSLTDPEDLEFDVAPPTDGNETNETGTDGPTGPTDSGVNETPTDETGNSSANNSTASDGDDPIPGFTAGLGLAGGAGAVALEWLRRRSDDRR
ncbi:LVIVD repeat-containing protein [Halopiger thermotolerans]